MNGEGLQVNGPEYRGPDLEPFFPCSLVLHSRQARKRLCLRRPEHPPCYFRVATLPFQAAV